MTFHERHGVRNYLHVYCLSNSLFRQAKCKHHSSALLRWRHQMETFSALLVLCEGNSSVIGEFPAQKASNVGKCLMTTSWKHFGSRCCALEQSQLNKRLFGEVIYIYIYIYMYMYIYILPLITLRSGDTSIHASVNWAIIGSDSRLASVRCQFDIWIIVD